GTAKASMFFDRYPRFYETSDIQTSRVQMNLRHEAIIAQHRDAFAGARVIDIASHDGRWSFAALEAGAADVLGIEGRESLVADAYVNLAQYGADESRYRFIAGDVFTVMAGEALQADVVMCLGFLYHTTRYNELLHHIRSTGARILIIDTEIVQGIEPFVSLRTENVERQGNAVLDPYAVDGRMLVGRPSLPATATMLEAYGYAIDRLSDWRAILRDNDTDRTVRVYAEGRRVTVRAVRRHTAP
ncbi:MAG TPA: class I SAM-dependent methyltransferase, partial [Ilumatobacteraceae bacterium]|nr:class I SAM-dependent methyltransferase [Ilumatobacteraceae bacterium]